VSGSAVHHAVLAHEAGGAVVIDNELERLVKPPVGAIAVPVLMSPLLQSDGLGIIQTDNEAGGLDVPEGLLVGGIGSNEGLAGSIPVVTVGHSQHTDRRGGLGNLVDALKLLLQLRDVQGLAVNNHGDLEELVLADHHDVLVLGSGVLAREVLHVARDAAAVEHVLVRVHGHGLATQVLGLERAVVDLALELENSGRNGSRTLGGVTALTVIAVGVEVGDVGNNGVTVTQVGGGVPPFGDPVFDLRVGGTLQQALLQRLTLAARANKGLDGLLGVLELCLGD